MDAKGIAANYGVNRASGKRNGADVYRIPEVCHGSSNKKKDLAIWDGEGGSVGAKCHSRQCSYQSILDALGIEFTYEGRTHSTSNGAHTVRRRRGPNKDLEGNYGSNKGLLVRLCPHDKPDNTIILVEGEKAFDALCALDLERYTPAHWVGGTGSVTHADYSPLDGREVVLWPDNDEPGADTMTDAAVLAKKAGATNLLWMDVGLMPEKGDAADCTLEEVLGQLEMVQDFKPPPIIPHQGMTLAAGGQFGRDMDGQRAALGVVQLEIRQDARTGAGSVRRLDHGTPSALAFTTHAGLETDPQGWASLHENADSWLRAVWEKHIRGADQRKYRLSKDRYNENMRAILAGIAVDPVKAWLEKLPVWDKVERLGGLFTCALGAEANDLHAATAKAFFVGGVKRVYEPGAQNDWAPVLIGDQGTGKTTFCVMCVPAGFEHWYSSVSNLDEDRQKLTESIGTGWIVELKEMRGVYGYKKLRAWLDTTTDKYRPPYGTTSRSWPRRWVAIGTANDEGTGVLPDDPNGNRRYVAVPVATPGVTSEEKADHVRRYMTENLEQLWAEALVLYREGHKNFLEGKFENQRDVANDAYQQANQPLEGIVDDLTAAHADTADGISGGVSLGDLMVEAGLAQDMQEAQAKMQTYGVSLAAALTKRKWVKRRQKIGSQTRTVWFAPLDTRKPCSICGKSYPAAHMADPDGRGLVCPKCRGGDADAGGTGTTDNLQAEVQGRLDQLEARGQVVKDAPLQFHVLEDWVELGMLRGMLAALKANPAAMPPQVCDYYGGAKALLNKMVAGARHGSKGHSYGLTAGEVADKLAAADWQPVLDRLREGYAKAQRRAQDIPRAVIKYVLGAWR